MDKQQLVQSFQQIQQGMVQACAAAGRNVAEVELLAASKTQSAEAIACAIEAGMSVFGENRVQEAQAKWPALKQQYPTTRLHMIGALQSNKAAAAVALFDCIESLDRESLAAALSQAMAKQNRFLPCLIEVNIADEAQKAGISAAALPEFLQKCAAFYGLNIVGLMCVPPADLPAKPFFEKLAALAKTLSLPQLSMGMSTDYSDAIAAGSTRIRVGRALFGARG